MNINWLKFVSISMLFLYGTASTAAHSNAYDNLLKVYNHERMVPNYHEKIYEILGGAQGFSDKPTTPAQLSNIVYITVHAALNSKEPDNLFLQKTLKENQSLINMPSLSEKQKKDRIYHYGILMVIYAATKLSQQDGNIFTLPERVQNYLKNLAEDSILTGVLSQPLKDILSGVNKDGIAQILVGCKFTSAYHSVSLNANGLMLDGAAVVDYTHSGITTREPSSNVTPSSSTGNMASVGTSDVPADIAHLAPKYIKKLKMMNYIKETDANKLSRQDLIGKMTEEQKIAAVSTTATAGGGGRGALFSQIAGGGALLKKIGAASKDDKFDPKQAKKVRLNKSSAVPVARDESSITKEIEKLGHEILDLEKEVSALEDSRASTTNLEKLERQLLGKRKLIEGKRTAIRERMAENSAKIREKGVLIAKKRNEERASLSDAVAAPTMFSLDSSQLAAVRKIDSSNLRDEATLLSEIEIFEAQIKKLELEIDDLERDLASASDTNAQQDIDKIRKMIQAKKEAIIDRREKLPAARERALLSSSSTNVVILPPEVLKALPLPQSSSSASDLESSASVLPPAISLPASILPSVTESSSAISSLPTAIVEPKRPLRIGGTGDVLGDIRTALVAGKLNKVGDASGLDPKDSLKALKEKESELLLQLKTFRKENKAIRKSADYERGRNEIIQQIKEIRSQIKPMQQKLQEINDQKKTGMEKALANQLSRNRTQIIQEEDSDLGSDSDSDSDEWD